jgi:hypothetical protein
MRFRVSDVHVPYAGDFPPQFAVAAGRISVVGLSELPFLQNFDRCNQHQRGDAQTCYRALPRKWSRKKIRISIKVKISRYEAPKIEVAQPKIK